MVVGFIKKPDEINILQDEQDVLGADRNAKL
jgi:hypothetical protein